ncbi:hypothetical protein NKR23_g4648 [Pleurostoma richardsiae]|uniref:EthD domain-containing protein n=1 Tax=Pleurostoma richardsiae TaxID=41990 RepID=A0AA38VKD7_9PEZI|nr:hypothetical protein NKR23_g4648 [Pleurostoma richardsiae]
MPFVTLMLIYRNPDMTPEQFRDHYENVHIPLVKSLVGPAFPLVHTRHYIKRATAASDGDVTYPATVYTGSQDDFSFDCSSELKFETEAAFYELSAVLARSDVALELEKDCGRFMDSEKTKTVVMGEINETLKA